MRVFPSQVAVKTVLLALIPAAVAAQGGRASAPAAELPERVSYMTFAQGARAREHRRGRGETRRRF